MGLYGDIGRSMAAGLFTALILFAPAGAAAADGYNVALFPFPGAHGIPTEKSRIVSDLLAAGLSANPRIHLVERQRLDAALTELSLSLTGIVEPDQAVRAGSIAGAQILIVGRLTRLGMKNALFARVTGVATSRTETLVVSAPPGEPVSALAADLSEVIAETIFARGPVLVAPPDRGDPELDGLKERLEGKKLPSLKLSVKEIFGGSKRQASAVEGELLRILIGAGFEIYEQSPPMADVIITAQALGEFAARRGGLISSSVELKAKAVTTKEKKVLAAARTRHTVADLSEEAAASRAFSEAAARVAPDLIVTIVEKWNE